MRRKRGSMSSSRDTPVLLACSRTRARVSGHELERLCGGWELSATDPGRCTDPAGLDRLSWSSARVPGTAAGALRDAGLWRPGDERDFDASDWWFRTSFHSEPASGELEQAVLCLDGLATVAEVYLNGERVLRSNSMFQHHALDVGARLRAENELAIRFCALAPMLRERHRPRARWRTRLADGNLRFYRTMLLGRCPGFAPGPAAVGPWWEIVIERRRGLVVEEAAVRPSLHGHEGRLSLHLRARVLEGGLPRGAELELEGPSGTFSEALSVSALERTVDVSGEVVLPEVAPWWPHTHGTPTLHDARVLLHGSATSEVIELGRVGFRALSAGPTPAHDLEQDGLDLHLNGGRTFARGAVWTPVDAVALAADAGAVRGALEQAVAAGMNLLRIPGTSTYETAAFHDLCDELGLLVWQDFMFANFDYPISEERFSAAVALEAQQVLEVVGGRPSTAVLCGNSEIEQQVAMLGLQASVGRGALFGELLPALARERAVDALYVPSAPCGGDQPFRPDRGVANYYGVGGYRRPLHDARRAEVRFAAECLALSNVPDESAIEEMVADAPVDLVVHHPRWKAGVPRDAGSGWDFEDVRDHYLALLFDVDPSELRRVDHNRYLELSRVVSGEVMAEVFGEWRRAASPCGGGLVLWMRDLVPGAGWGLVDHRGEPKAAYHYLRRALAPVAVWTSDEGLGGLFIHVANDRPDRLDARLRLALYREQEHLLEEAVQSVEVPAHSSSCWNAESLLGRFADLTWAYRFGPPQQDLVVVALETVAADGTVRQLSQSMFFPAGRPRRAEPASRVGLRASAAALPTGGVLLRVHARKLAYAVRVRVPGFIPGEDAFSIEPVGERLVSLLPRTPETTYAGGTVAALNARPAAPIEAEEEIASGSAVAVTDISA